MPSPNSSLLTQSRNLAFPFSRVNSSRLEVHWQQIKLSNIFTFATSGKFLPQLIRIKEILQSLASPFLDNLISQNLEPVYGKMDAPEEG